MADSNTDKEYKGPGRFVASTGRGNLEAIVGGAIGVGLALFSKNVRAVFKSSVMTIKSLRGEEEAAEKMGKKLLEEFGDSEKLGKALTKGAVTAVALPGAGLAIGGIHGSYRGTKDAAAGKQQVDDLNDQVDKLTSELASTRAAALKRPESFAQAATEEKAAAASAGISK